MSDFPAKLWFGFSAGIERTWRRLGRKFDAPEVPRGDAALDAWERVTGTEMAHAGFAIYFLKRDDALVAQDVLAAAERAGAPITAKLPVGPHAVGEGRLCRWKLSFATQPAAGLAYDVLFDSFYGKDANAG